jgi:hypothetical protein
LSASHASTITVSLRFFGCAHKTNAQQYPKLQLRTVKELMDGKGIERPSNVAATDETFKKAPASKKKLGHQKEFGLSFGARGVETQCSVHPRSLALEGCPAPD